MKWLHSVGSGAVLVATLLAPSLQAYIAAHPSVAVSVLAAYAFLGNLLRSPLTTTVSAPLPVFPPASPADDPPPAMKGGV